LSARDLGHEVGRRAQTAGRVGRHRVGLVDHGDRVLPEAQDDVELGRREANHVGRGEVLAHPVVVHIASMPASRASSNTLAGLTATVTS
jgi:hypothetical protein